MAGTYKFISKFGLPDGQMCSRNTFFINNCLYIFGYRKWNVSSASFVRKGWKLDITTGQWTDLGGMDTNIAGTEEGRGTYCPTTNKIYFYDSYLYMYPYDVANNTWGTRKQISVVSSSSISAHHYNGNNYFIYNGGNCKIVKHDPTNDSFTDFLTLGFTSTSGMASVIVGDSIYLSGRAGQGARLDIINLTTRTVSQSANLTGVTGFESPILCAVGTKIRLMGYHNTFSVVGNIYDYNINTDSWSGILGTMPVAVCNTNAFQYEGNTSVIGGDTTRSSWQGTSTIVQFSYTLDTPTNFVAALNTEGNIVLTWVNNSVESTHILVDRKKTNESIFTTIATLPANATTYTDTITDTEFVYNYRIRAKQILIY
jgi:hypothetical protein